MGNTPHLHKKDNKKSIQMSHPQFQTAQLIKNDKGIQQIEITVPLDSEKDYIAWEKNYKRIPKVNATLFPEGASFHHKGMCGSSGIANIQFPRYPYLLQQEIQVRRNNNQGHFGQNQLWLLLYTLVSAGEMFYIRKLKVGDIRPQNVFMNSQGNIKIGTQYSYPKASTNYEKTLMNRELITYLAPQQVKDIQFGKMKDTNDPQTVETFSIGLTLLDAALLASSDKFYEVSGIFNYDKLNQSLKLLKHINYSPQITFIIQKMLQPQPANRLKSSQVLKLLHPYQAQILGKKPFPLDSLPVQKKVQIPKNNNTTVINKKIDNNDEYKFVPGVVFDSKDNGLLLSTLMQGKEGKGPRTSKTPEKQEAGKPDRDSIHFAPITINLPEKKQITGLEAPPIQTIIHYPPSTIHLPQPIAPQVVPQNNGL